MTSEQAKKTRRRMAPEVRREVILDAAHGLFMTHGWEVVTIADVLNAAGISKGGFYHHFTAKEDLLTAIVARLAEQSLAAIEVLRRQDSGDALARLRAFLTGSVRWKADNIGEMRFFAEVLTKPGNDILYRRVLDASTKIIVPVLETLVAEGATEGTFDAADPRLTAEVIVGLAQGRRQVLDEALRLAASGELDRSVEHLDARMQAEGALCDRLLGLPPGSIPLSNPGDYRRMLAGLVRAGEESDGEGASA